MLISYLSRSSAHGETMTTDLVIKNRIINAAEAIWQDDPLEVVYQHSLFCQIALPRSKPKERVFERTYRNGLVRIEAGALGDGKKLVDHPWPSHSAPASIR